MARRTAKEYGLGSLLSTLMMTVAAGAAIWVHMLRPDYTNPEKILPLVTCVLGGGALGWFFLSRNLDRGQVGSGFAGVSTALIGVLLLAGAAAIRSATLIQMSGQFVSNPHMISHMWDDFKRIILVTLTDVPTMMTLLGVAFLAGMIGNILQSRRRLPEDL